MFYFNLKKIKETIISFINIGTLVTLSLLLSSCYNNKKKIIVGNKNNQQQSNEYNDNAMYDNGYLTYSKEVVNNDKNNIKYISVATNQNNNDNINLDRIIVNNSNLVRQTNTKARILNILQNNSEILEKLKTKEVKTEKDTEVIMIEKKYIHVNTFNDILNAKILVQELQLQIQNLFVIKAYKDDNKVVYKVVKEITEQPQLEKLLKKQLRKKKYKFLTYVDKTYQMVHTISNEENKDKINAKNKNDKVAEDYNVIQNSSLMRFVSDKNVGNIENNNNIIQNAQIDNTNDNNQLIKNISLSENEPNNALTKGNDIDEKYQ